ncbi:MAG: hypothetical protein ACRDPW_09490, partial [Mycobacteriales bacterium]
VRLRGDDVHVGSTKAFMILAGKPWLHWCLKSLRTAGIYRLVIAGDRSEWLERAGVVVARLEGDADFDHVEYFGDTGDGVHGLPFQARDLLDDTFVFDGGSSIMDPRHYRALIARKTGENAVFSSFTPDPANLSRYRTFMAPDGTCEPGSDHDEEVVLGQPMVIDRRYVGLLAGKGFNVRAMADHYAAAGRLAAVRSAMPPECNVGPEYWGASRVWQASLKLDPVGWFPWVATRLLADQGTRTSQKQDPSRGLGRRR